MSKDLTVIDLDGKKLTITNLNKAIEQAKCFSEYEHVDSSFNKLDQKLKKYWNDLYQKLIKLS